MLPNDVASNIHIARHVVERNLGPRLLSQMLPYDVARNIRQALDSGTTTFAPNQVISGWTEVGPLHMIPRSCHVIHHLEYLCSPCHPPRNVPVLATSSTAKCTGA
jgi:hypothetical protein